MTFETTTSYYQEYDIQMMQHFLARPNMCFNKQYTYSHKISYRYPTYEIHEQKDYQFCNPIWGWKSQWDSRHRINSLLLLVMSKCLCQESNHTSLVLSTETIMDSNNLLFTKIMTYAFSLRNITLYFIGPYTNKERCPFCMKRELSHTSTPYPSNMYVWPIHLTYLD